MVARTVYRSPEVFDQEHHRAPLHVRPFDLHVLAILPILPFLHTPLTLCTSSPSDAGI